MTTLNTPLFYRLSSWDYSCDDNILTGDFFGFFNFMYDIQHCFICRPTDSTVSEDAEIEPRTVVTSALAVRRSSHSATSHPQVKLLPLLSISGDLYYNVRHLHRWSLGANMREGKTACTVPLAKHKAFDRCKGCKERVCEGEEGHGK